MGQVKNRKPPWKDEPLSRCLATLSSLVELGRAQCAPHVPPGPWRRAQTKILEAVPGRLGLERAPRAKPLPRCAQLSTRGTPPRGTHANPDIRGLDSHASASGQARFLWRCASREWLYVYD